MAFVCRGSLAVLLPELEAGGADGEGGASSYDGGRRDSESIAGAAGGHIYIDDEGPPVAMLGVGAHLGELSLLQETYRHVDVRAQSWTNLQILTIGDWKHIKAREQ